MDIPKHIAIIPDGNRRWAKEKNLPTFEGHRRGFDVAVKISRKARQLGVSTITLWGFSTENWKRTTEEVSYLMGLYEILIDEYLKEAIKDEVRIIHIGRKDRLKKTLLKKILNAEEKTKHFEKYFLNIAIDYGGRDEIIRTLKKISSLTKILDDKQNLNISEEEFEKYLDTSNQPFPNPDIIVRTSGEMRTSGFMIWQSIYAEWFFLEKYFPDLTEKDLEEIIENFNNRQRRFGS